MTPIDPPQRELVFVGGGHAHALALRMLAMEPPPGLRLTLISPAPLTPYSGMLPGLLAGHYSLEDTHIDLTRFCQWAGVRFLTDTVTALDPVNRVLRCERRGELQYDLLSIDIGSQPELDSVPGAREHAVPVKPVAGLWQRWTQLQSTTKAGEDIAIVGGGAGSVEVAMAMAHRFGENGPALSLYCGADQVLPDYPSRVRRVVEAQLKKLGIALHCGHRVARVESRRLHFEHGGDAPFATLIWSTGAAPAPWIAESGLPVDRRGFMAVDDTLRSTGFANVFGAGDIATQIANVRPKAGVFAVRQAPVLAHNLAAAACGNALREHRPQRRFLSLMSLGEKRAVAERNGLSIAGDWVWRWKDSIDRRFMNQFTQLQERSMAPAKSPEAPMPCGGCGAKVNAKVLTEVLDELRRQYPDHAPPPGAVDAVPLPGDAPVVQSVDMLRALVADPWRMGRIAAQHALSDLYASGADPRSAQALIVLPFAAPALLRRDLLAVLRGAMEVLTAADCSLLGGHSMEGPELQVGFVVNGTTSGAVREKTSGQPGDQLILTRPLGSGALFAAQMQSRADGRHVEAALMALERGNGAAARIARDHGASALTDVTGFGLAGHLAEMLGSRLSARVTLSALPVYDGALKAMAAGIFSTLHEGNRDAVSQQVQLSNNSERAQLLFDPQTSGGLLMSVAAQRVDEVLGLLRETDTEAAVIGELRDAGAGGPLIEAA